MLRVSRRVSATRRRRCSKSCWTFQAESGVVLGVVTGIGIKIYAYLD